MNVLVTFALRWELVPWLRLRTFRRIEHQGCLFFETTMAGTVTVRAVLTGMGPSHAKEAMLVALESRPDAVVASGLAGGLKPWLRTGDIFAPRLVRDGASDRQIKASPELLDLALDCGAVAVDSSLSSDTIAWTAKEKAVLGRLADAVDMESFAVLNGARDSGIPAIVLRGVADTGDRDLPCDFSKMTDELGQLRMWRLALEHFIAPQHAPSLIRFALASQHTAVGLAWFLERYFQKLGQVNRLV